MSAHYAGNMGLCVFHTQMLTCRPNLFVLYRFEVVRAGLGRFGLAWDGSGCLAGLGWFDWRGLFGFVWAGVGAGLGWFGFASAVWNGALGFRNPLTPCRSGRVRTYASGGVYPAHTYYSLGEHERLDP